MLIRSWSGLLAILFISFFCNAEILPEELLEEGTATTSGQLTGRRIFQSQRSDNLILNSDFNALTNHWVLAKSNGARAKLTVDSSNNVSDGNTAHLIIEEGTNDKNNIQLIQNFKTQRLTRYTISFRARVTAAKEISIIVANDFESYWNQTIVLQPSDTSYGPFIFESQIADHTAFLSFASGGNDIDICFDSIAVFADDTQKDFERIISNSGINILSHPERQLVYIEMPFPFTQEVPIVIIDPDGQTLYSGEIGEGHQSELIDLKGLKTPFEDLLIELFLPERKIIQKI